MIIPFWIMINKKSAVRASIRHAAGILSSAVLRIPQGVFFNRNHTWAHLEKSGRAKVGLDDLLLHITGEVTVKTIKNQGDHIKKGELLAEIDHYGKVLKVFSPLSGEIAETNANLNENPALLNEDPYGEGWVCSIKPAEWVTETHTSYLAEEALEWSKRELERFRDFMAVTLKKYSPEASMLILQDGGELSDRPLSELPDEVWQEFQDAFLNQHG
jgi:glycine cleavage system H protein